MMPCLVLLMFRMFVNPGSLFLLALFALNMILDLSFGKLNFNPCM